jgi:hypothetical protein
MQNEEIFAQVNDLSSLNEIAKNLLDYLKKQQFNEKEVENDLIWKLQIIANNFLTKFLLFNSKKLDSYIEELIYFFLRKNYFSLIHLEIIKKKFSSNEKIISYLDNLMRERENIKKSDCEFENFIIDICNLDKDEEKGINRKEGEALLELNGDIIWADCKTKKLLELNLDKSENFFSKLIPFSKHYLCKKFECEKDGNLFNSFLTQFKENKINFKYVIYSDKSFEAYENHLKKKGIKYIHDIQKYETFENKYSLYHKYLKCLNSEAQLISLCLDKKTCNLDKNDKYFNFEKKNKKIKKNKTPKTIEKCKKPKKESDNEIHDNIWLNNENLMEKDYSNENNLTNRDFENNYYKYAILLKTKVENVIPDFNFNQMVNDEKIKEYEKKLKSSLN